MPRFFQGKLFVFLSAFLALSGLFLFSKPVESAWDANIYNKPYNGTLTATEWNNLLLDFPAVWLPVTFKGPVTIGTSTPTTLNVNGTITATTITAATFSGAYTGTTGAQNVSSGAFGSNTGGGNYSFPGNVGVGTSSPISKLQINGGTGTLATGLSFGDGDTGFFESADDTLNISRNGADVFFLDSNGLRSTAGNNILLEGSTYFGWANRGAAKLSAPSTGKISIENASVGIGTTNPAAKLDIRSAVYGESPGSNPILSLGDNTTLADWMFRIDSSNEDLNIDRGYGLSYQVLTMQRSSGNVGIGITNPAAKLDIFSNAVAGTNLKIQTVVTGAEPSATIDFLTQNISTGGSGAKLEVKQTDYQNNAMIFSTESSNVMTEKMRIHTNGNVGIGTITPVTKLAVSAGTSDVINVGGGQIGGLNSTPVNPDQAVPLGFLQNNYIPAGATPGGIGAGTTGQTLRHNGTSWVANSVLYNNGTNIGIGTSTPSEKLYVSGGNILFDNNYGLRSRGSNGVIHDLLKFTSADITQIRGISGIQFQGYNSGWQDSVRITNDGKVGIGTVSPSAAKLHIASDSSAPSIPPVIKFEDTNASGNVRNWRIGLTGSPLYGDFSIQQSTTKGGDTYNTRFYIKNDGNVGINSTNPFAKLNIRTTGVNNALEYGLHLTMPSDTIGGTAAGIAFGVGTQYANILAKGAIAYEALDTFSKGAFRFLQNSASTYGYPTLSDTVMSIMNNGNVGIGTSSPSAKLAVSGGTGNIVNVGGGQIFGLNSTPTNADHAVPLGYLQNNYAPIGTGVGSAFVQGGNAFGANANLGTNDNYPLNFETNGTARMTVAANGNVGVGTTNPQGVLDIAGGNTLISASSSSGVKIRRGSGSSYGTGLTLIASTDGGADWSLISSNNQLPSNRVAGSFVIHDVTNNSNRFTILPGGNVGIGVTNPTSQLHVNNDLAVNGAINHSINSNVKWVTLNMTDNTVRYLQFNQDVAAAGSNQGYGAQLKVSMYLTSSGEVQGGEIEKVYQLYWYNGAWSVNRSQVVNAFGIESSMIRIGEAEVNGTKMRIPIWAGSGFGSGRAFAVKVEVIAGNGTPMNFFKDYALTSSSADTFPGASYNQVENRLGIALGSNVMPSTALHVSGSGIFTGNLGVGTTNPQKSLHIVSGSYNQLRLESNTNGNVRQEFVHQGAALNYAFDVQGITEGFSIVPSTVNGGTTFSTPSINIVNDRVGIGFNMSGTSGVRFAVNGNLGVGTTTTNNRLDVSNSSAPTGNIIDINGGQITGLNSTPINSDHAVPLGYLQNNYAPIGTGVGSAFVQGGNTFGANANLGTNDNYPLNFETNSTTRMTIAANGNVGIGTTDPGSYKLRVTGNTVRLDNGLEVAGFGAYSNTFSSLTNGYFKLDHDSDSYVNNTGNFGIGTSTPQQRLHVNGIAYIGDTYNGYTAVGSGEYSLALSRGIHIGDATTSQGQLLRLRTNGLNNGSIIETWNNAAGTSKSGWTDLAIHAQNLKFQTGQSNDSGSAVTQMYINSFGNVGIGTTNPGAVEPIDGWSSNNSNRYLEIKNSAGAGFRSGVFIRRDDGVAGLDLVSEGNLGDVFIANRFNSNTARMSFLMKTASTDLTAMTILGSGNVGIGSSTPNVKLVVSGGTGDVVNVVGGQIAGLNSTPVNSDHAVPLGYLQANYSPASGALWSGTKNGDIWNGDAGAGNVGIGKTNPTAKLDVNGGINIPNNQYYRTNTNNVLGQEDGNLKVGFLSLGSYFQADTSKNLMLVASSSERMRVTPAGNVGIGTGNPATLLDINGGSTFKQFAVRNNYGGQVLWLGSVADSIGTFIGSNAYYTTSYNFKPNYTAASGINFRQDGSTEFWNDTGLTSGTDYVPTKRMVILANGNVGIGTTNPSNKLFVNGFIETSSGYKMNSATILDVSGVITRINNASGMTGFTVNTSGNERLRITSTGNVGVNTTTPAVKFVVDGGTGDIINVSGGQIAGLNSTPVNADHAVPLGYLQNNYAPIGTGVGSAFVQGGNIFGSAATLGTNDNYPLNLETNGSVRLSVGINGSVGVGTSTVNSAKLLVFSEANQTEELSSTFGIGSETVGKQRMYFGVNNTNHYAYIGSVRAGNNYDPLILQPNGSNVGIGTTNPTQKLDVAGSLVFSGTAYGPGSNNYWNSNTFNLAGGTGTIYARYLKDSGSNSNMTLTGGNVGISTTNPQYLLDINNGANNARFHLGSGTYSPTGSLANQAFFFENAGGSNAYSIFQTKTAAGVGLNITNAGNVSVGTTTPVAKFVVDGGTGDVVNVSGGQIAGLNSTPLNSDHAVPLGYLQANYTPSSGSLWSGTKNGTIWNGDFGAGNVAIGTTTASKKLTILTPDNDIGLRLVGTGGETYDIGETAGNEMKISSQTYLNLHAYHRATSDIQIRNADIIMRQPTYFTVGNVGVGTTSPLAKLDIVSTGSNNLRLTYDTSNYVKMYSSSSGYFHVEPTARIMYLTTPGGTNSLYVGGDGISHQRTQYSGNGISIQDISYVTKTWLTGVGDSYFNGGNVGIGTTTPGAKLDVLFDTSAGNRRFRTYSNAGVRLQRSGDNVDFSMNYGFLTNSGADLGGFGALSTSNGAALDYYYIGPSYSAANLVVKNNGNTGIGTTSPVAKLSIGTTDNVSIYAGGRYVAGLDLTPINPDQAVPLGYLQANYNASSTSYWSGSLGGNIWSANTGNVGVGTTTPSEKIEILGRLKISGNATGWSSIGGIEINDMYNSANARRWAILGGLSAQGSLDFRVGTSQFGDPWANGTTTMTILRNGYVGIGTSNPQRLLEVAGSNGNDVPLSLYRPGCNWTGCGLRQEFALQDSSNIRKVFAALVAGITTPTTGAEDGIFAFMTMKAGTLTEGMRLNKDGYLGIGTTNPLYPLHIYKTGVNNQLFLNNPTGAVGDTSGILFGTSPAETYAKAGIFFERLDGTAQGSLHFATGNSGGAQVVNKSNARMTITMNGNVGIGTTTPNEKLTVMSPSSSGEGTALSLRHPLTGAGDNVAIKFWPAGGYIGMTLPGKIVATAPAGNNIGFNFITNYNGVANTAMAILPNGNLGIGTTSPVAKLAVNGGSNNVIYAGGGYVAGLDLTPVNPDQAVPLGYLQSNYSSTSSSLWSGAKNGNIWNGTDGSGNVGIGITNPVSKLHVNGGVSLKRTPVDDTNYTAQADDYIIGYTSISANRTVTLPNALCTPGRFFVVVDESGNASASAKIIIDPESTTPIIGLQTLPLEDSFNSVYVFCGNNAWYIL